MGYWHCHNRHSSENIRDAAECCVKESHVRITFSYSNLHEVIICIIEISWVRVQQQQEWRVTWHLCVWQCVQVWGDGCTHYLLTQQLLILIVFTGGTLTNQQTDWLTQTFFFFHPTSYRPASDQDSSTATSPKKTKSESKSSRSSKKKGQFMVPATSLSYL